MNSITVAMSDHSRGKVYLDGVEVKGVTSVNIDVGVDKVNQVTLSFHCAQVAFEAEVCEVSGLEGAVE